MTQQKQNEFIIALLKEMNNKVLENSDPAVVSVYSKSDDKTMGNEETSVAKITCRLREKTRPA